MLFRYVFSGFVVIGTAYLSHPSWFTWYRPTETLSLISLGTLTIVAGALAYSLHRFSLHQFLDYVSWKWLNKLGQAYRLALKEATEKGVPKDKRNDHIAVRSSQLIFLFISGEALGLFAVLGPEKDSWVQVHSCYLLIVAIGALVFAAWQYTLVNQLDRTLDR